MTKKLLPLAVILGVLAVSPALAEGAVDDLKTEVAKVSGIADSIFPVAIGAMVFSGGAAIVKRVFFA